MKPIYLDYAAATPISDEVLGVMKPYFSEVFYNPSALYSGGRDAKTALDDARGSVARTIGSRPSEITFTAGGTESANLAIKGVMEQFPETELIVSAIEHKAVLEPAKKYNAKLAPVDSSGKVILDELSKLISNETVLVSIIYANNEVGTVQPISKIVDIIQEVRRERKSKGIKLPIYLHTDAAQAPQFMDVNVARLGVDLMTLNGGKLYGPKQSGILYHRTGVILSPQILGGGQEYDLRSGTENVASCVGFAKALEMAVARRVETVKQINELSKYFIKELENRFTCEINGHRKNRLPNNIHLIFAGRDNERMLFYLDQQGIFASVGSACSASSEEASHVLTAMGLSEADARSSLRFSLGRETTKAELDFVLKVIADAIKA